MREREREEKDGQARFEAAYGINQSKREIILCSLCVCSSCIGLGQFNQMELCIQNESRMF
jgi:hypothetical protein